MPLGTEVAVDLDKTTLCKMGTQIHQTKRGTVATATVVVYAGIVMSQASLNRGPCLLWPNGWFDQDTTCQGARPRPRRHCVRWGTAPHIMGHSSPQHFHGIQKACVRTPRRMFSVAKRLNGSGISTEVGLGPASAKATQPPPCQISPPSVQR